MVTYFNRKDLVSFGSYLLSEKRKNLFEESYNQKINDGIENPLSVEDSLKNIHHADFKNWIQQQKNKN